MEEKRKNTYTAGGCETEIDFVLVEKKDRMCVRDVKVVSRKVQHKLVVVHLDQRVLKNC